MTTLTTKAGVHAQLVKLEQDLYARLWIYLEPLGVNRLGFSYLEFIAEHEGCKTRDIVDAMHMDRASVTRSLNALGRLGYLDRQMEKPEARAFALHLSPAGKTIIETAAQLAQQWEDDLRDAMGPDDYDATLDALARARERILVGRARTAAESNTRFFY